MEENICKPHIYMYMYIFAFIVHAFGVISKKSLPRTLSRNFILMFSSRSLWWSRQWHPTPVLLPGKSHGRMSLVGCSPWGRQESDMTERLHFHFSLSCIGEGNGNPLQCSCLENPRDRQPGGLPSMGSHRVGHD